MLKTFMRLASSTMRVSLIAVGLTLAATAADACGRMQIGGAGASVPEHSRAVNMALLDAALLAEVNAYRCRSGLAPLGQAPALRAVAGAHADWMAQNRTITHAPALPRGLSSFGARLAAGGYANRAGAENIAMVHRFALEGQAIFVRNASACQFADRYGRAIAPHSYASLAAHLMAQWIASPGHRNNLLNPQLTQVAHAVAIAPDRASCGQVYAVQLFAG